MVDQLNVDLSKATEEQLREIHHAVLRRLAERAKLGGNVADGYDRHGSGHSRSGTGSSLKDVVTLPGTAGRTTPK